MIGRVVYANVVHFELVQRFSWKPQKNKLHTFPIKGELPPSVGGTSGSYSSTAALDFCAKFRTRP